MPSVEWTWTDSRRVFAVVTGAMAYGSGQAQLAALPACQGQGSAGAWKPQRLDVMVRHAGGSRGGWARVQSDILLGKGRGVVIDEGRELEPLPWSGSVSGAWAWERD